MKTVNDLYDEIEAGKQAFIAWLRKEHKRNSATIFDFDDGRFDNEDTNCHCPLATWIRTLGYDCGYMNNDVITFGGWNKRSLPKWVDEANKAFKIRVGDYNQGPVYISIESVLNIMEFLS